MTATEYERVTGTPLRLPDDELVRAERWVIGSILKAGFDCLGESPITARDFDDPRHEALFELMGQMRDAGQPIDQLSVARHMKRETVRDVTASYLLLLTDSVIQPISAEYHAAHVMREAHYRRLQAVATRFTQMVDERADPDEIAERVRTWIAAAETVDATEPATMGDAVDEALERVTNTDHVPTPWTALNRIIGGWRPGRLYVVGARPGAGKTILGVQAAVQHASRTGSAVAVSSLEMDRAELTQRAMCAHASVDFSAFINNQIPSHSDSACTSPRPCDMCRLAEAGAFVRGLDLPVDDSASQNPARIRAFVRGIARRRPVGLVVVDYLQLMDDASKEERQAKVARWSRAMKVMARELHVPVIVLSQLNRESDKRPGGAPRLSDLRESGALEQDADVVLLMAKDEMNEHGIEWVTVDVAKNRQGPRAPFSLRSESQFMRLAE